MGLDMYLYAKKDEYVSEIRTGGSISYPAELEKVIEGQNAIYSKNYTVETRYNIGYWRKANAIHGWIVDHCAGGVDECQSIEMDHDKICELRNACQQVLLDHSKAEELLPPTEGFFFGSNEVDEYYLQDLRYTVELLQRVLDMLDDDTDGQYTIEYQASW